MKPVPISQAIRETKLPEANDAVWHGEFQTECGKVIHARLNWRLYDEILLTRKMWRVAA